MRKYLMGGVAIVAALAVTYGIGRAAELSTTNDENHRYGWIVGQGGLQLPGGGDGATGATGGDSGGATGGGSGSGSGAGCGATGGNSK